MKTDLLKEWYDAMRTEYWKNENFQKFNSNSLSNLEEIYKIFKDFFPEDVLNIDINHPNQYLNWLQEYFFVKQPEFIMYGRVLGGVLDYFEQNESHLFKLKKPKPNHIEQFRDVYFEWYTNFIFRMNGIETKLDFEYEADNERKEVDCYFTFENREYIVECAKVYDKKISALKRVGDSLMKKSLFKNRVQRGLSADIVKCSYIIVNDVKNVVSLLHKIENDFQNIVNEYYSNMNSKSNLIKNYAKVVKEDYELFIGSNMYYQLNDKSQIFKDKKFYIVQFGEQSSLDINKIKIKISNTYKRSNDEVYDLICERIERKKKQHKKAPHHLIIFLEFEMDFLYSTDSTYDVDINRLDFKHFEKYVSDKCSILFMSKKYINYQMQTYLFFLCKDSFDEALYSKLLSLHCPI